MSSEFESVPLGELTKLRSGYSFKSTEWRNTGTPVIKIANLKAGRIVPEGCAFVDEDTAANAISWMTEKDDVLIAMTGYVGEIARVRKGERYLINQRVGRFDEIASHKITKPFLFYALQHPAIRSIFEQVAHGSAQPNLSANDAHKIEIPLPDLTTQFNISELLGALDDRIALLRETNATLEAIAQAMFKSWFVDFDPVHAKQQGRAPEGMSEATAALFPDSFEESELGLVPRGWCTCAVYDLAQYINGAAYKAFEPNSEQCGLPIIKIAELKAGVTKQTGYSNVSMPEKYRITTGDILFSWSGNPDTSIDTFVWLHGDAWLNQHIFRVVPSTLSERSFVLMTLKYLNPIFAEIARNKQTTGLGHVTVADLKRLRVVKPSDAELQQWNEIVDPLIERAFNVQQQAQTLATLRDTLLPRLISGQLRLPDLEGVIQ